MIATWSSSLSSIDTHRAQLHLLSSDLSSVWLQLTHCRNSDMVGCYSNSLETAVMHHTQFYIIQSYKGSYLSLFRTLKTVAGFYIKDIRLCSKLIERGNSLVLLCVCSWAQQDVPDISLHSNTFQLHLGDLQALPYQTGYNFPSLSIGSIRMSLSQCAEELRRDWNPWKMSKLHLLFFLQCQGEGIRVHTSHSKVHRFIVTCGQNCVIFNPSHCKFHEQAAHTAALRQHWVLLSMMNEAKHRMLI